MQIQHTIALVIACLTSVHAAATGAGGNGADDLEYQKLTGTSALSRLQT